MLLLEHAHEALVRLAGELAERGESRLPTERVLAQRLETSRTTVRKALDRLEEDQVIRRVGAGPAVPTSPGCRRRSRWTGRVRCATATASCAA